MLYSNLFVKATLDRIELNIYFGNLFSERFQRSSKFLILTLMILAPGQEAGSINKKLS